MYRCCDYFLSAFLFFKLYVYIMLYMSLHMCLFYLQGGDQFNLDFPEESEQKDTYFI
jgi:hypothetical protein